MRYWTSDLHLGHKNILNYCKRPFADHHEMTAAIVVKLLSVLKPKDKLVVVGDVALNPKYARRMAEELTSYGVHLILIPGNHDACFEWKGKEAHAANMRGKYYADGWKEIYQNLTTELSNGLHVEVNHLPYGNEDGLKYDQRYVEYRPKDKGSVLIHGHLHGRYKKFGRMIDVGWDSHNGEILSEDELIALIQSKDLFVPTHLSGYHDSRPKKDFEK